MGMKTSEILALVVQIFIPLIVLFATLCSEKKANKRNLLKIRGTMKWVG